MKMRSLALALALSLSAFVGPLSAQSLFSSGGLGLPVEPIDGRARALGSIGLGLGGGALLPTDPAAAARLLLPRGVLVGQPTWADASGGGQTNSYEGSRFPLLAAAYPFVGGIVSVHFAAVMDQDFRGTRDVNLTLGGQPVVATDEFDQDGSVAVASVGFARMLTEETSVGLTVGRYTGKVDRTLVRTLDAGPGGSVVQPYVSTGNWSYSGYHITGGAATRLVDLLDVSASATWSTALDAAAEPGTVGGDGSFDIPLQLRLGASAALSPGLTLSASAARADWSGVGADLNGGGATRTVNAVGVGLELSRARLLGREAPLRLGFRTSGLPFSVNDRHATERIFSGGLGLILNQSGEIVLANVDVAVERGRRQAGSLTENFWRATVALAVAGL